MRQAAPGAEGEANFMKYIRVREGMNTVEARRAVMGTGAAGGAGGASTAGTAAAAPPQRGPSPARSPEADVPAFAAAGGTVRINPAAMRAAMEEERRRAERKAASEDEDSVGVSAGDDEEEGDSDGAPVLAWAHKGTVRALARSAPPADPAQLRDSLSQLDAMYRRELEALRRAYEDRREELTQALEDARSAGSGDEITRGYV